MTSLWKLFFAFFLMLGTCMPIHVAFAGTCVCTTTENDCQAAPLSIKDETEAACTAACKKNLTDNFASSKFAEDIEGEIVFQQCRQTHEKFIATKTATSTAPSPTKAAPKALITPILNVEIPGLKFSDPIITATTIKTSFVADYLNAIYAFLIGTATIIAIVMIMVGGLQYTIGAASSAQVEKGKDRIKNGVTGLVLLLCVFLVLKTTNPQLVLQKMIELQNVQEVEYNFSPETLSPDQYEAGPFDYKYFKDGKCPVQLTHDNEYVNPPKNTKPIKYVAHNLPRRLEFHEKIRSLLTGSTRVERVLQAVEAASLCKIQYANCGAATHAIYALASKPGSSPEAERCLINKDVTKECNSLGYGNGRKILHNALSLKTIDGLTIADATKGIFCPAAPFGNGKWKEPCYKTKQEAAQRLTQLLQTATGGKNWSPSWVDDLQPGDYYVIVNWNPSVGAAHSAMFLGWQDKTNRVANIESADGRHFVHMSTTKFGAQDIVVQISRPIGD
ncbi:hypothetical protein A2318_01315 [Candidatus Uhrbacteria bacterium RIFOXYB2_FULL_45_11]|uniref:Amidase domain-containing protein n=1 Tax=Candidatus Uhrbacteria bacterium RIFOXYB2_FULL_45_11 TaxID=1802421 RepID=A0A1F7W606_9BACT|nr:MAG: hypothetical protein A2318_01315 [Candidatus Uhrbacteria bacterium RIFOXYB2_FULL_45_11]